MKHSIFLASTLVITIASVSLAPQLFAKTNQLNQVDDQVISDQKINLKKNVLNKGFGPQSPRDIDSSKGKNKIISSVAPPSSNMNLCNIHFHKGAEHKGGEFTKYAGHGDGHGNHTGYLYSGTLSKSEKMPLSHSVCSNKKGSLQTGDTIEIHYVHSSAAVEPGPTLGACLSDSLQNPQLRVEAQVFVLVNDHHALDFKHLMQLGKKNNFHQAFNIPNNTGKPVVYSGSTTGPSYNEAGSPFQVTWSVRPQVAKVNIDTVGQWCENNIFDESGAHGVRNLISTPELLSTF